MNIILLKFCLTNSNKKIEINKKKSKQRGKFQSSVNSKSTLCCLQKHETYHDKKHSS